MQTAPRHTRDGLKKQQNEILIALNANNIGRTISLFALSLVVMGSHSDNPAWRRLSWVLGAA